MKAGFVFVALVGVLLAGAPAAMACTIQAPGSAAEAAARFSALQAEMWDKADLVFVARVEQVHTKAVAGVQHTAQVDLMPLTWLKGQGGPWQFELGYTGESSCGPEPHFDAIAGQPGETFIVFARGDTPGQDSVVLTLKSGDLVEPRALAELKAQN